MNPITGLLTALGVLTVGFVATWARLVAATRHRPDRDQAPDADARLPTPMQIGVGFGSNFFDALGIGSFATTTAIFRLRRMVPDRVIPGTLNVGHALPTVVQAFIYTVVIPVDVLTLFSMIAAAVLGAWLGAGVVAQWPKRKIQIGMGIALLVAATLMTITQVQGLIGRPILPLGGEALGVRGSLLATAIAGNFMLGALMTLGIGLYAPCMILISLLGMNPRSAFPIMMGSCAFLMPIGSVRFIRERAYSLRNALGLAIGGIPGVLIAAYIVKELPLSAVRWLVIVVVVYTALMMLLAARAPEEKGQSAVAPAKA
jgi:uncharacterized membrane protein YfcA